MITAVDTNILIDLLSGTSPQSDNAEKALNRVGRQGDIIIPVATYAELAFRFQRQHELDRFVSDIPAIIVPLERPAAFLAGAFFREYVGRGGSKTRIIADFLIAAQAQIHADRLLTLDKRFFGSNFPKLKAVSPADLA